MGIFNKYPYTNFHELNADWIIEEIQKAAAAVRDAKAEVDAAVAIMQGYDEHLSILDQGISSLSGQILTVAGNLSTLAGVVETQGDRINSMNAGLSDLASHAVQTYEQEFSDAEQAQARTNIGAVALTAYNSNKQRVDAILEYQGNQISALEVSTATQAGQITALQADMANTVKFTTQNLTNAQKLQARQNIGAAAAGDTPGQGALVANIYYDISTNTYTLDGMTAAEIATALNDEFSPVTIVIINNTDDDVLAFTNLRSEVYGNGYSITGTVISNEMVCSLEILSETGSISFTREPLRLPVRQFVTGTTPTISVQGNMFYVCDELASLTITGTTPNEWSLLFTSGTTPTITNFPSSILGLENFAAEANTIYEINVLGNRAVVGSWAVPA